MRPLPGLALALLLVAPAAAKPPVDLSAVDARMQALVAQHRLAGASLWLSHNGAPALTAHYGSYDDGTRVPIASASKWVSALVLARLVERGALRWDSTVGEWWPEADAAKRGITLAQLFSHTSGIAGEESGCLGNPLTTLQACAAQILAAPLAHPPGSTFSYGGLSMHVAGAMAERAAQRTWDQLFIAEVVQPLGLVATDYGFTSTAPGYVGMANPRIAGGLRSTLADYARLMAMWQAEGVIVEGVDRGQRYLASTTIREMRRDRAAGLARASTPPSIDLYPGWGYGVGYWLLSTTRAGTPLIESSPGAFGFQGWVDGRVGLAGVLLVRDANARLAADVQGLQREAAAAFELQRSNGAVAAVPGLAEGGVTALAHPPAPADGQPEVPRRVRHRDGAADGVPDERGAHRHQHRP